jgi:hypothetical protein
MAVSDLSDAELMAALGSQQSSAPAQDVSSLSDLDLLKELGQEVKPSFLQKASSGVLSGLAGFGDLADVAKQALYTAPTNYIRKNIWGMQPLTPSGESAGQDLRSTFDSITGVKGSTEIGSDSYA